MDRNTLRRTLREMEVPDHRRGLTETNVKWLLRNLAIRNQSHPNYNAVNGALFEIARRRDFDDA